MDDRSIKETVRMELKKLAGLSWGQRIGYIWDYYKPLMVAILVIIACISMGVTIYHNLQINHIFQAYLINSNSFNLDTDQMTADFTDYIGGIGEKDEITIDTSMTYDENDNSQFGMASQMKLVTYGAAGEMDLLIGDDALYDHYAQSGGMMDMTEVLSEEELDIWEDYLVWETDPETGEEFIAALKLNASPVLEELQAYPAGDVYAMIPLSAKHPDMSRKYLEYLMGI